MRGEGVVERYVIVKGKKNGSLGYEDDLSGAWYPIVVQLLQPGEHGLSQNTAEVLL